MDGKHGATGSPTADTWAPGSARPPLPLPPDAPVHGPVVPPAGTPTPESDSGPKGWRKFFAFMGVVFAFPFLLTIPGWIALSVYRKWKDGERDRPTALIIWGVIATTLFVILAALSIVGRLAHTTNAVLAPPGFRATPGELGWTVYTSHEFSISLPTGWRPYIPENDVAGLFTAANFDPSYAPGERPSLAVRRLPAIGPEIPRNHYDVERLLISRDPKTFGEVQMSRAWLPAGRSYILRWVRKDPGSFSVTMYGLLLETSEYQLFFAVPTSYVDSYQPVFQEIAATFTLVE